MIEMICSGVSRSLWVSIRKLFRTGRSENAFEKLAMSAFVACLTASVSPAESSPVFGGIVNGR